MRLKKFIIKHHVVPDQYCLFVCDFGKMALILQKLEPVRPFKKLTIPLNHKSNINCREKSHDCFTGVPNFISISQALYELSRPDTLKIGHKHISERRPKLLTVPSRGLKNKIKTLINCFHLPVFFFLFNIREYVLDGLRNVRGGSFFHNFSIYLIFHVVEISRCLFFFFYYTVNRGAGNRDTDWRHASSYTAMKLAATH